MRYCYFLFNYYRFKNLNFTTNPTAVTKNVTYKKVKITAMNQKAKTYEKSDLKLLLNSFYIQSEKS